LFRAGILLTGWCIADQEKGICGRRCHLGLRCFGRLCYRYARVILLKELLYRYMSSSRLPVCWIDRDNREREASTWPQIPFWLELEMPFSSS
uniref:Secreted protein n=1 Tax=Ascaris lumbricoides TaxID=6252 RepID=A0A0M3IQJ2_ASCLU